MHLRRSELVAHKLPSRCSVVHRLLHFHKESCDSVAAKTALRKRILSEYVIVRDKTNVIVVLQIFEEIWIYKCTSKIKFKTFQSWRSPQICRTRQTCLKLVWNFVLKLSQTCLKLVSNPCLKSLSQTCRKPSPNLSQACLKLIPSLPQACLKLVSSLS